jgi:hypothetical protein
MCDSASSCLVMTNKGFRGVLRRTAILALVCACLTTFASTVFAQEGMFVPTGSMTNSRESHTATLLNNGMVLIAGGYVLNGSSFQSTALAELYDPATGSFTVTGNMTTARGSHTATLLNNGKVLFAAGVNGGVGNLASAELYDPATGTFTATGSMTTVRFSPTAALLNNGKVLVVGGYDNSTIPNNLFSAELYDPTTGTFTPTGSMTASRVAPTATLLNNGKVLVAGGENVEHLSSNIFLDSAELYDPATGTFTATGKMTTARYGSTATLLNNGKVLVAGGVGAVGNPASAELYDPATGTFTATGSMTTARNNHTAALLNNGKVLVAGGGIGVGTLASAELYGPATGTFTTTGTMNAGRYNHTATLLNNSKVLVAAGVDATNAPLASAELYEPVVISPTSLSFLGQIVATTSASQTVTLTNNQSTALSITSIAISGTNASDFAETDNCVGSVAAGAICTINVTFTPAAAGSRTGALTITNNVIGSQLAAPLTGTGITATRIASLSANSLTFTNQMVGSTSTAQGITFGNTGNEALIISNLAVGGTNATDFAETDNCGGSVAAGASCTINVTFSPAATGTRTGTLSITDNATSPLSPQTVALTGTGIPSAPIVSLSSTSIAFATQSLGTASAAQTVTLRNTGAANLNIQVVALGGANPGDFTIANVSTCTNGATVATNGSCVIQLTFTPTGLGTRGATVGISDNAADSPETISLSGTTAPTPLVSVTPSNISFPVQYVGTSGLPQSVTVTNDGNAPLNITSVGASPGDFAMLNACGNTLAVGASCAIGVFFDPTASGTRPGTLTINDNAPGSPQTAALSGTGQDFSLAPVSSASATVSAGQTANFTVAVSPGGGFNQSVAFACTGAPSQSTCVVSPSSIALSGSAAATVAVSVTTMAASLPMTIPPPTNGYRPLYLIFELLVLLLLTGSLGLHRCRRPQLAYRFALLLLFVSAGQMMSGCGSGASGGGGNQRTPAGTYTVVVSGTFTSGSTRLTHNTNLTLVVQ